jgi:hypothetical protein
MKINLFYPLLMSALFLTGSCNRKKEATQTQTPPQADNSAAPAQAQQVQGAFVWPQLPSTISDPVAQANYLSEHFWDSFNFNDTLNIHLPDLAEQIFPHYLMALFYADKNVADKEIEKTLSKADAEETGVVYAFFVKNFKNYLYDPNSPMREEEYYMSVLKYILASKRTGVTELERAQFELDMAMKNRKGEKAADIKYTLPSGKTGTLYDIKAQYTLLFFYNPDCHGCADMIEQLKASPILNQGLQSDEIKLLAFYPDEDLSIWKKHFADIPAEWINGYDKNRVVELKKVYDLKAIPTLYLLDVDKRVIGKDIPIQALDYLLGAPQTGVLAN